jgi:hypothetical protein
MRAPPLLGPRNPSGSSGEHLLAHEVARTVQQSAGSTSRQRRNRQDIHRKCGQRAALVLRTQMVGTLTVEQLIQDAAAHDGEVVSVAGQFIAAYASSLLCGHRDALEVTPDRPRIVLEPPDLVDRCFRVVSPYGGGPWYYHDPATVTGRFLAKPEPRIVEIQSLVIHRRGVDRRVEY